MPYITPSATSWLPNWDKSAELVGFIRDPKKFPINDYVAIRPARSNIGVYYKIDPKHGRRYLTRDMYRWPEGAARPTVGTQLRFDMPSYRTERYDIGVAIGKRTLDNAAWDLILNNSKAQMQLQMTILTNDILTQLESTANWGVNYSTFAFAATKGVTGAGLFVPGATTTNNYIKTALDYALIQIMLATGLAVSPGDFNLVLSPNAAQAMSATNEVIDFVKQSQYVGGFIQGKDLGGDGGKGYNFSLPRQFHGFNIVIENTSQVIAAPTDDTTAATFCKSDNSMYLMLKQSVGSGDQVGQENEVTMNWSTFQIFYYDPGSSQPVNADRGPGGLAVLEAWEDPYNRRTEAHVVWDLTEKMVASESGWLFTNLFS